MNRYPFVVERENSWTARLVNDTAAEYIGTIHTSYAVKILARFYTHVVRVMCGTMSANLAW